MFTLYFLFLNLLKAGIEKINPPTKVSSTAPDNEIIAPQTQVETVSNEAPQDLKAEDRHTKHRHHHTSGHTG